MRRALLIATIALWPSLAAAQFNGGGGISNSGAAQVGGGTAGNAAFYSAGNTIAPNSGITFSGSTATITAPVLSGTATGTYTLGGTPTIASPAITGTTTGTYTLGGTPTLAGGTLSGTTTLPGSGSVGSGGIITAPSFIPTSNTAPANGLYLTANGPAISQGSTITAQFGPSQTVALPGLASSSAAQTGTVCWTTVTGNLTVDTTVACLTSLEELKDIHGPITGALAKVMALQPFWFNWKDATMDPAEQPGLGAHQVAGVDKRLAAYTADGTLRGVRYQEMTAVLVAAIQEQQAQIAALNSCHLRVMGGCWF